MHHNVAGLSCALAVGAGSVTCAQQDVVSHWNAVYLDTVRQAGGAPGPLSRTGAMVHAAMFDAINSIRDTHEAYLTNVNAPAGASQRAAAAQAAYDVLVHEYPQYQAQYDAALQQSLKGLSGQSLADGKAIGSQVASALIAARANDGSGNTINYTPGQSSGDWRPTWPDYSPAVTPHWGNVTPWGLQNGSQFQPPLPPSPTSAEYTAAYKQVKELGEINSQTRTQDQTEAAFFWANDVNGTYKPPGHLNSISQVVADQQGLGVAQRARLLALANIAMADAGIAAWDSKYNTPVDFWRPVAGIREADNDGNPETIADPNWTPLNTWTPAFPAYVSGHATFAGAHAEIMRSFFGTDAITFICDSDDPNAQGVFRTFNSFTQAAEENAWSRVWLGVHWSFDATYGLELGTSVGEYVYANYLQPVPAPGTVMASGLLGMLLMHRRRRRGARGS